MLKKYIRSMLESYRGSHKSVPSQNVIDVYRELPSDGEVYVVYTAPTDGWFVLQVADSTVSFSLRIRGFDVTNIASLNTWGTTHIPLAKGEEVSLVINDSTVKTKKVYMHFFKHVGS